MLEIGSYLLEIFPEETRENYSAMPSYNGEDDAVRFFQYLLPKAEPESIAFLESLGIDPKKISAARPLTQPDENGEILYLCTARLSGKVISGGDTVPRQSEEIAGVSVIFVPDEREFTPKLQNFPVPQTEMRFVIPLPFDASFFE